MKLRQIWLYGWSVMDPIYYCFTRLHHVKKKCGKRTIFRVRVTRYKGRDITLADGTAISKNDLLLKVHLHNVQLLNEVMQYKNDLRKGKVIYSKVKDALPAVADYIHYGKYPEEIKGLIGITTLYKGCKRLGFEPHSIVNPFYKKFKQIALMPIYFLSSNSYYNLPEPKYLIMSKATLLQKYGSLNDPIPFAPGNNDEMMNHVLPVFGSKAD